MAGQETGQKRQERNAKKRFRGLKIAVGVFLGFWAVLFLSLHFLLHTSFLPRTVSRLADDYVDGDFQVGSLEASVFRHFPRLDFTVGDLVLTYPHEKFAAYDSVGVAGRLRDAGRGPEADTLAAFRRFSLTLDLPSMLRGRIHVRRAVLDGARIYAHRYDSTAANWDILTFLQTGGADTASAPLPHIRIDRVALTGDPRIVFTDPSDTLFASVKTERIRFNGRLLVHDPLRSRIGLDIDSLFVAGRLPTDTLAAAVDRFRLHSSRNGVCRIDADARVSLALGGLGRIRMPVTLGADVSFPDHDFRAVSIRNLAFSAASLPLIGEADIRMRQDSLHIRAEASIPDFPVQQTLQTFAQMLDPSLQHLKTDAKLSLTALCDGYYIPASRILPDLAAEISIPPSTVSWEGIGTGRIGGTVGAESDSRGRLGVTVEDLDFDFSGICLTGSGFAEDLLSDDPLIGLDLEAQADLDDLNTWLPDGMTARGRIHAAVSGMALLSDMDLYNFSRADLDGHLSSPGLFFSDEADSLTVFLGQTEVRLDKNPDKELGIHALGVTGQVDSLHASYGKSMFIRGSGIRLSAQNAAETVSEEFGREVHPVVGSLSARGVAMSGADSLFVGLRNTGNSFRYSSRSVGESMLPLLALSSRNGQVFIRKKTERLTMDDVSFSVSALRRDTARDRDRRRSRQDTLGHDPAADSLFLPAAARTRFSGTGVQDGPGQRSGRMRRIRREEENLMQEDPFRGKDLDIRIDTAVSRYVRDWNLAGNLSIGEGRILSPYFPISNAFSDIRGAFTTDEIRLDNLALSVGRSDLSAQGGISGLRRAMLRNGIIRLDFNVGSNMLDANELISTIQAGNLFRPEDKTAALDESVSDAQYLERISSDIPADAPAGSPLIVIPSNVTADIHLQGDAIRYADLDVDWFASDIVMKERTLQVTNTVATSNMGDIYFEGFYSTRSKRDLTAGFNLNLAEITAEKVITLIPAVDSIIPMLKSFKGMLDCEITATSQLDTAMNLIAPTVSGIMKISGKGLSVQESGDLRKIAKLLLFKDTRIGHIDDMKVEGVIGNNTLEIFPFVLGVDRYQLAMSGIQNFDQSFDYHISVLKSPIPFRFGVNVFGNFGNWHYHLGKARYKNADVPVFTTRIDTLQYNLVHSIHDIFVRGVDAAVRQTRIEQEALSRSMEQVVIPMESLTEAEHAAIDSLLYEIDHPADAPVADVEPVQTVDAEAGVATDPVRLSFFGRIRAFLCPRYREAVRRRDLSAEQEDVPLPQGRDNTAQSIIIQPDEQF